MKLEDWISKWDMATRAGAAVAMSEPLTDEEEFEHIKEWLNAPYEPGELHIPDSVKIKFHCLIGIIELQKSDKDLGAALVRKVQELKKENAKPQGRLTSAQRYSMGS